MRIAIIPARGGSKRIPNKNVKEFLGVPIIGRVIGILKESDLFDRIIISTDSKEIARVSASFGAEVPFMRPNEIAGDFSGTPEVIRHAISELQYQENSSAQICCVYPTSVLMNSKDLTNSLELLKNQKWDYVFAASEPNSSPLRSFGRSDTGEVEMLFPHHWASRSQDLSKIFVDAGFFYWATSTTWMKAKPIFAPNSTFVEIPEIRAVDINSERDWIRAESIFELIAEGRIN